MKEKKKKILLMFHHLRLPKDRGGLRSWHIGKRLAQAGYEVVAIVPGIDTLSEQSYVGLKHKLWIEENINGIKVVRVNSTANIRGKLIPRILYYLSFSVTQLVRAAFEKDVSAIVCTSMPLPMLMSAYLQTKIRKVPWVVDVRDLNIDAAIELGYIKSSFMANIAEKIEKELMKRADRIVPVSNGMAKILKEKGINEEKLEVVNIGWDNLDESQNSQVDEMFNELRLNDKFVVLYAGTMGYVVDIETVLRGAELLREDSDIAFLLVGDGQRLEEYKRYAKDKGLPCFFTGARPKKEIAAICRKCDVAVYPLKGRKIISSLMGNKIYDYLGNGLPTIYIGPSGDVADIIEEVRGGACVPMSDSERLSEEIEKLKKDRKALKEKSLRAKSAIREKYTIGTLMNKFCSIIDEILAQKP